MHTKPSLELFVQRLESDPDFPDSFSPEEMETIQLALYDFAETRATADPTQTTSRRVAFAKEEMRHVVTRRETWRLIGTPGNTSWTNANEEETQGKMVDITGQNVYVLHFQESETMRAWSQFWFTPCSATEVERAAKQNDITMETLLPYIQTGTQPPIDSPTLVHHNREIIAAPETSLETTLHSLENQSWFQNAVNACKKNKPGDSDLNQAVKTYIKEKIIIFQNANGETQSLANLPPVVTIAPEWMRLFRINVSQRTCNTPSIPDRILQYGLCLDAFECELVLSILAERKTFEWGVQHLFVILIGLVTIISVVSAANLPTLAESTTISCPLGGFFKTPNFPSFPVSVWVLLAELVFQLGMCCWFSISLLRWIHGHPLLFIGQLKIYNPREYNLAVSSKLRLLRTLSIPLIVGLSPLIPISLGCWVLWPISPLVALGVLVLGLMLFLLATGVFCFWYSDYTLTRFTRNCFILALFCFFAYQVLFVFLLIYEHRYTQIGMGAVFSMFSMVPLVYFAARQSILFEFKNFLERLLLPDGSPAPQKPKNSEKYWLCGAVVVSHILLLVNALLAFLFEQTEEQRYFGFKRQLFLVLFDAIALVDAQGLQTDWARVLLCCLAWRVVLMISDRFWFVASCTIFLLIALWLAYDLLIPAELRADQQIVMRAENASSRQDLRKTKAFWQLVVSVCFPFAFVAAAVTFCHNLEPLQFFPGTHTHDQLEFMVATLLLTLMGTVVWMYRRACIVIVKKLSRERSLVGRCFRERQTFCGIEIDDRIVVGILTLLCAVGCAGMAFHFSRSWAVCSLFFVIPLSIVLLFEVDLSFKQANNELPKDWRSPMLIRVVIFVVLTTTQKFISYRATTEGYFLVVLTFWAIQFGVCSWLWYLHNPNELEHKHRACFVGYMLCIIMLFCWDFATAPNNEFILEGMLAASFVVTIVALSEITPHFSRSTFPAIGFVCGCAWGLMTWHVFAFHIAFIGMLLILICGFSVVIAKKRCDGEDNARTELGFVIFLSVVAAGTVFFYPWTRAHFFLILSVFTMASVVYLGTRVLVENPHLWNAKLKSPMLLSSENIFPFLTLRTSRGAVFLTQENKSIWPAVGVLGVIALWGFAASMFQCPAYVGMVVLSTCVMLTAILFIHLKHRVMRKLLCALDGASKNELDLLVEAYVAAKAHVVCPTQSTLKVDLSNPGLDLMELSNAQSNVQIKSRALWRALRSQFFGTSTSFTDLEVDAETFDDLAFSYWDAVHECRLRYMKQSWFYALLVANFLHDLQCQQQTTPERNELAGFARKRHQSIVEAAQPSSQLLRHNSPESRLNSSESRPNSSESRPNSSESRSNASETRQYTQVQGVRTVEFLEHEVPLGCKDPEEHEFVEIPNAKLFGEHASDLPHVNHVLQGDLGDCWIFASLLCMLDRPESVKALFLVEQCKDDVYVCKLYHHGETVQVKVTNKFPRRKDTKQFVFAQPFPSGETNIIWACVLEKCLAALWGAFGNMHMGDVADGLLELAMSQNAMVAVTRFKLRQVSMNRLGNEMRVRIPSAIELPAHDLWELICDLVQSRKHCVLCTVNNQELCDKAGLKHQHAYAVLGYYQQYVAVRDPIGAVTANPFSPADLAKAYAALAGYTPANVMWVLQRPLLSCIAQVVRCDMIRDLDAWSHNTSTMVSMRPGQTECQFTVRFSKRCESVFLFAEQIANKKLANLAIAMFTPIGRGGNAQRKVPSSWLGFDRKVFSSPQEARQVGCCAEDVGGSVDYFVVVTRYPSTRSTNAAADLCMSTSVCIHVWTNGAINIKLNAVAN